jgi:uncharacterized membrane protein YsdA (DUF1294 family)/cold shock CspA family protein
MRQQGRVVEWHDSRGYGFVVTHGTEQRIFLHIKHFASGRMRRPEPGDILTYEVIPGERGRMAAGGVAYVAAARGRPRPTGRRSRWGFTELIVVLFGLGLAGMVWAGKLSWLLAASYPVLSVITYLVYRHDKQAAMSDRWRTPESTLQLLALFGGWPGAWLAQKYLRHKSSKASFQQTFWIVVVLNAVGLFWLSRQLPVA